MSQALAVRSGVETKWTITSGPMLGSVRLMNASSFTIGRSPDCEFVIVSDPKCSRKHATVTATPGGCQITSLSEGNPILVNGQEVQSHILDDGDILTVGTTLIQFNLTSEATDANIRPRRLAPVPRMPAAPLPGPGPVSAGPRMAPRPMPVQKKSNPLIFVYVALALVVGYLMFSNSEAKKKARELRSEQQVQDEIDRADKLRESADKMPIKQLDATITSRQAQENYVRGFRDFRKGQYERSLDAFNTCLALDASHVLCNRYKLLAQRKFNELVQMQIVLGRRYRDQNQFKACRSSFRNVMAMIKDANSASYRESKANYDACNALAEGHF